MVFNVFLALTDETKSLYNSCITGDWDGVFNDEIVKVFHIEEDKDTTEDIYTTWKENINKLLTQNTK